MALQDDVRKFILEIEESKNNQETLANLTKLEKETAKMRHENEELVKVMAHLATQGKKNSQTYKDMDKQLKSNKKAMRENGIQMKGLQKNLDLNFMSMGQLRKRANELRSTLNATSKAANPKEYDRLEKELKQVGGAMDKLKGKGKKTQGVLGKLKGAAGGMLPAFGFAAIAAGFFKVFQSAFNFTKQVLENRKQIALLTKESGENLANLTAAIQATADTYQKDVKEMAVANNALAKSFNITQEAANDLINVGFVTGADASGEFLAQLREYPAQFAAAGVSAETMIAIMSQSVTEGIYSDKGADVIKEGTIRLREMTTATQEALAGIGISSSELEQKLREGSISYFDAIQLISDKLAQLPDQSSEVGTAIADIFGGPGEDAGIEFLKLLGRVETDLGKLKENSGEGALAQDRLRAANERLNKSWNRLIGSGTGWFDTLKAFFKETLAGAIDATIFRFQQFRHGVFTVFQSISLGVQNLFTRIKQLGDIVGAAARLSFGEIVGINEEANKTIEERNAQTAERVTQSYLKIFELQKKAQETPAPGPQQPVTPEGGDGEFSAQAAVNRAVQEALALQQFFADTSEEILQGNLDALIKLDEQIATIQERQAKTNDRETAKNLATAKRLAEQKRQIKLKELNDEQAIGNAKLAVAGKAIDVLIQLAGEESKIGKALYLFNQARAIGEIIFNTGIANAKAVAASPLTFGQPWVGINTLSAGISIASIIGQSVSKLSGGGGGASGNVSGLGTTTGGGAGASPRRAATHPTAIGDIAETNGAVNSTSINSASGLRSGSGTAGSQQNKTDSLLAANVALLADLKENGIIAKNFMYNNAGTGLKQELDKANAFEEGLDD